MKRQQYNWHLPPEIERRLGEDTYGRPRAISGAGQLLLILRDPPAPSGGEPKHQVFLRRSDGKYLCNGDDFGDARLLNLLALYQRVIHEAEETYARADSAAALFRLLGRLGPLARATANLYSALQTARTEAPNDALLIAARDKTYDLAHDVELLLGDARMALDYRVAHEAEVQAVQMRNIARAQHKLNILAAVTFPLMSLATLMGMNLTHGLEGKGPPVFWLIVTLAVVLGILAVAWVVLPDQRSGGAEGTTRRNKDDGRSHGRRSAVR